MLCPHTDRRGEGARRARDDGSRHRSHSGVPSPLERERARSLADSVLTLPFSRPHFPSQVLHVFRASEWRRVDCVNAPREQHPRHDRHDLQLGHLGRRGRPRLARLRDLQPDRRHPHEHHRHSRRHPTQEGACARASLRVFVCPARPCERAPRVARVEPTRTRSSFLES